MHLPLSAEIEAVARSVVDSGLKVHTALGPGLLESAYEHCLAFEMDRRGHPVRRQVTVPILYEGLKLDAGHRIDILVAECIVVEVKTVDAVLPVHQARILTYLRLSGHRLGFLMNFNVALFKNGLRRVII